MAKQLNVNLAMTADTSQAKKQLQQLQQQLTDLTKSVGSGSRMNITQDIVDASKAAQQLKIQLEQATNVKTGKLDLGMFQQQMKQSGMSLEKYRDQLIKIGPDGAKAFSALASSITKAEIPIKRSNALLSEFATTMKNTARWQISSSIMHGFIGSLQSAYGYAQRLNESLNNIRIVTGQSADQMADFAERANRAARELSSTTTQYTDAALIFYQQGLDDSAVTERTNAVIKMAHATGDAAKEVSSYMTAIWNNFDDGSTSLEHFGDVLTALGASTASSTSEISEGLEKFASIAQTVGLSYEYATSALATVVAETRQSADVVGTAFKTMFARIGDLELGKTLEDGVDLGKYSQALDKVGVSILDATGNMRKMDDILDDLASKWDTLTNAEQTALAETVAGTRQYTQLMALMNNWDDMTENLNTANNADGTLDKQQEIYAESWEAARDRVTAAAEDIYNALLDDDFFIALTDGFATFLHGIDDVIDGLGGLQGVLLAIGAIITTVFQKQVTDGIQNALYNIKMLSQTGRDSVKEEQSNANKALINDSLDSGTRHGADMSVAYTQQAELQQTYIDNAEHLSEIERQIASSMLDQQQVLIANVEQSSKELENAEKKANIIERDIKTSTGKNTTVDLRANELKSSAKAAGQYQKALDNLAKSVGSVIGPDDIQEMQSFVAAMADGVDIQAAFGEEAQEAFNALQQGLSNGVGVDQLNDLVDNLFATADGASLVEDNINLLTQDLIDGGMSEELASQRARELADQYLTIGQRAQDVSQSQSQLKSFTERVSQAFQEQSQKNISLAEGLSSYASVVMSVGMAISSIKGLIQTWGDDSKSAGDKVLATITTLGMAIPMLTTAFGENSIAAMAHTGALLLQRMGLKAEEIAVKEAAVANGEFAATLYLALPPLALLAVAVIAVVGVVWGLIKAFEAIEKASPSGQLKDAKEEAASLAEATDEAKNKVQELKSAFDGYDSVVEKLKSCTEGTQEWKDALLEVNNQVLDLVQKYPELSGYVDGEKGQLYLKDGYQDVLSQAEKASQSAQMASISKNAEVAQLSVQNDLSTFSNKNYGANYSYDETSMMVVDEDTTSFLKKHLDELSGITEEQYQEKLKELDATGNIAYALEDNYEEIQELGSKAEAAATQMDAVGKIAAQTALDTEKYSKEAIEMAGQSYDELVKEKYNEAYKELKDDIGITANKGDQKLDDLWAEYQAAGGHQGELAKNAVRHWGDNREFYYDDGSGGKAKSVGIEEVANTIAAARALEQLSGSADTATSALQNLSSKDLPDGVANGVKEWITSGNLEGMTEKEYDDLVGDMNGQTSEDYLKNLFGTDDLSSIGIDAEVFESSLNDYKKALGDYKTGFTQITQTAFDDLGDGTDNLTLNAKKSILNVLEQSVGKAGEEGLSNTKDLFGEVFKDGEDNAELFAKSINEIDFDGLKLDQLKEELVANGVEIQNLSDDKLQSLLAMMQNTGSSLAGLTEQFQAQHEIIDGLSDGSSISADKFSELEKQYQDYFHLQLDGTYKLVGAAEDLQKALKNDQIESFQNLKSDLRNQNTEINKVSGYDFDSLSKTQASETDDGYKYNLDEVNKQLELIEALNQGNEELRIKIQGWKEDLADHGTTTSVLQDIADEVENCRVKFESSEETIKNNELAILQADIAIAESAKDMDELRQLLDDDEISMQAFNTAAIEMDEALDLQNLDPDELEEYSKYLKKASKEMDNFNDEMDDNEAKIVAKGIMKMNGAIDTLADNFVKSEKNADSWIDILKKSEKTSQEYAKAMTGTKNAVADLLDVSADYVSEDFISEHLDEINKAATGDVDAIDNLKASLSDAIVCDILINNGFAEGSENYTNLLNDYNNLKSLIPDIKVGASVDWDDASYQDFVNACNDLIQNSGMTADQVNAMFDTMGFETNFETESQPVEKVGHSTITSTRIIGEETYNLPDGGTITVPSTETFTTSGQAYNYTDYVDAVAMTTDGSAPQIKSITKKATASSNNYSPSNKGGKSSPGKSKSGGGGRDRRAERQNVRKLTRRDIDKEKISNKERDKERERYVEINDKIDDVNENLTTLNNKLSSISAQEERAFGATKQKLLQKQRDEYIATNKELEKQYNNYKRLEKEQKNYLKSDRKKAEKAGWNFDKNGNVKNYDKTFNKLTQDYNNAVDKAAAKYIDAQNSFNKLSGDEQKKKKNKNALDKAEEAYNEALEKAKEKREEAIELLKQVQEDQEALEDTQHKLEENIEEQNENSRKILDADLETINHALELTIEVDDDALKQLELEIKLLGTSAETASQRMSNLVNNNNIQTDKVQGAKDNVRRILMNQLGLSEDQAKGFLNGDDSAASQVYEALNREDAPYDSAAIWDALKGDLDIINGSIEALEDNMSNAFTIMNDFLDETMEAFDRSSKAIQHAKTLTQGYKDIMTAVGRRNVDKSGALTQTMDKALISESGNAYDAAVSKKDTAKYEYDKLIADYNARKKTGQMTETEKDEYEDLVNKALENLQTAEEEAQSSLQEWIQSVSDYYTDQIELIRTKFEETVAGAARSISWLKEQMSMKDARDNQYVEDYERIYQLSKLTRDVTKKIDESDNVKVKKMLAEYQDKIVKLQKEGTELSQHDLEYLQKQYEITLAKAQLEEAQNAKTQVRMTRDSEGNFSYVYTADEQNVEDAEQNYETKLYEAQKLNNDYINELENLIISAQEEMSAKIEEIMLDETLTYEEQQQKIEEIKDHYLSMMDYYEGELTNTLNSNKDLYNEEWQNYHEATGHQIADISTMKTNWGDLSIAVLTGKTDMSTYFSEVESAIKEMSSSGVNQLSNVKTSMGEVLAKAGLMTSKIVESKDKNGKATSQMEVDWTSFGDRVTTIVGDANKGTGLVGAASKAAKSSKDMATSYKASFNDITSKFKDFLNDYEKKATSTSKVNSKLAGSILDVGKKAKDAANSLAELAAKINALKDRTIKIKINYEYNDPKDKTPSNTTKKPSSPSTTTKKSSGSSSGSKPSWDDVKRVYNLINTQKLGNGRPYRTEEAEKYGYDKETYLLAQRYVNLVYPKNLGGKAYSSAAAKKALGYDTGGYTGDWNSSEGKLAFLHQKEIVLNQEDTKNMLAVVNAVRDISKMIDLNVLTSLSSVGTSAARFNNINKDSLEQNVHITAEFPNVTDKNEILDAFDNVINLASQYANKKK